MVDILGEIACWGERLVLQSMSDDDTLPPVDDIEIPDAVLDECASRWDAPRGCARSWIRAEIRRMHAIVAAQIEAGW